MESEESKTKLTLDLVNFYNILKDDVKVLLNDKRANIDKSTSKYDDIQIIHSGSGFEDLYIPHNTRNTLNTDSDHMVIITSYRVCNSFEDIQHDEISNDEIYFIYDSPHQSGYVYLSKEKTFSEQTTFDQTEKLCLSNEKFLKSCEKRKVCSWVYSRSVQTGPSLPIKESCEKNRIESDIVYCVKLKQWPRQADSWLDRNRVNGFPSQELINSIHQDGVHLVPVSSHHAKYPGLEWRLSFSMAELKLLEVIPESVKQTYALGKTLIKMKLASLENSVFSSYQFKTSFLWYLEEHGLDYVTHLSQRKLLVEILGYFLKFYKSLKLPNYFVEKNNMLSHFRKKDIDKTSDAIENIPNNLGLVICEYLERHHVLPFHVDSSLVEVFNNSKFALFCKYNFLSMSLALLLFGLTDQKDKKELISYYYNKAFTMVPGCHSDVNSNFEEQGFHHVIMNGIDKFIENDHPNVTEISAISIGLLNIFFTMLPSKTRFIPSEPKRYAQFVDLLVFCAKLHDVKCDRIYKYIESNWKERPRLFTNSVQGIQVSKLFTVVLGKPTKQTRELSGSMFRQEKNEALFLLFRQAALYLLYHDFELSYISFQVVSFLFDKPVLSEILGQIKYAGYHDNKVELKKLIFSRKELVDQLDEEDKKEILLM